MFCSQRGNISFPVWEYFFLLIVAKWPTLNLQKQKIAEKPMDKGFQLGGVLPQHSTTHPTTHST
jgi:hypothetical protein